VQEVREGVALVADGGGEVVGAWRGWMSVAIICACGWRMREAGDCQ
jgi:hypothetical protein